MRLDHVSFAAGPDGLASTAQRIGGLLGTEFVSGGVHPRFGTRNMILPLAGRPYMEIVEVLDHPASDKAPFGQAVRARSALGGGWLGWVVSVDELEPVESRLGREAVKGNRHRPDGTELLWQQVGVNGLLNDPQLPYFIHWQSPVELHPSSGANGDFSLACLEIAGDPQRVSEWLGETVEAPLEDVKVDWVAPNGTPGIVAVQLQTPARPRPHLSLKPRPSPNIWHTPGLYELENRAADPHGRIEAAMREVADWSGRAFLDIGCGTGFHLPLWAASAASVVGVEPHPPLVSARATAYEEAGQRQRRQGDGRVAARRRRVGRRGPRPLGLLLRPRLRARAARARPGRTPRRHGVRDRQRPDAVHLRPLVPPRLPEVDPVAVERFWSIHGWQRRRIDMGWSFELARGPRGRRPHRAAARGRRGGAGLPHRHRGRLRRQPVVARL